MKAVEFGAGNIGRGLIAPLLYQAGFETTFVDVNQQLIDQIHQRKQYPVRFITADWVREVVVDNVDAINVSNTEEVTKAIIEADLITTAVGERQLPLVAPTLAHGLTERFKERSPNSQNILVIACENFLGNTQMLKNLVLENSPKDIRAALQYAISWTNSVVDMIVPNTSDEERKIDPLLVTAEDYQLFAIDKTALNGPMLDIPGIKLTDRLGVVQDQKFFTFSPAHCGSAYEGYPRKYRYLHEAMEDQVVDSLTRGIMDEGSRAVTILHPEVISEQVEFSNRNYRRLKNPHLLDELTRIGREPIRKLSPNNRLVLPAQILLDHGIAPIYLAMAMAAAYQYYDFPGDLQALELSRLVKEEGLDVALEKVSGLSPDHDLARMIKASALYKEL